VDKFDRIFQLHSILRMEQPLRRPDRSYIHA
jgi:hypothetical protein